MAAESYIGDGQEWQVRTLRDANVALIDCDHRTPPAQEEGYPYVTIPQLKNGRIELWNSRRISREHYFEWTRKAKPSAYDVVLSRRCNPGETAFVPPDVEFALGQNLVLLRSDGTVVYPPFLRWLVRGPEWWDQIKTFINVGAVFESLRCADIPNFSLCIPPLREQKLIAGFLGVLDERIELLQKESLSLEQIARTIFKSWFVDFDPVRAKAEGREPKGMDADTAALFPSEFLDSEFGEIPRGWKTYPVGDLATVMGGSTPSTKESECWDGGEYAWATPKDLSSLSMPILLSTAKKITSQGLARISSGLLNPGTVLLSSRAPIGYLAIAEIPTAINQGFIAMKAKDGVSNLFLLFWTKASHEAIVSRANGSTFLEISKSAFRPMPVIVPGPEIMASFDSVVRPLYEAMVNNEKQSRTLVDLRDTLLPRLISGKLRVPEAEAMLMAV